MLRNFVSVLGAATLALMLAACTEPANQKHPPQDPPDYKGVPTDDTPPSMLIAPTSADPK
ncbi:hypothetical protein P9250_27970 [Caballeronia sp. LP006]|jgi:hypothetical protein|uniref:hypothetical protein n=2 Tax=Caballeronia TaxID=1827195 RepID=UPI002028B706|nr:MULTISPECIES: hypothetical protein [unclassified Caballeronia]MDR5772065.1 hypothetical protein [Caballeronia sp. LZ002]MDR5831707.1 hypothetical protein [Caballeronia sp. LP006]MDR5847499.1 hypothetical protein [Caballeronia sp. LZ003]